MVIESVIPETPEFDTGKWMDLNMMMMATGRERTAVEFHELLDQSGFALEQIVIGGPGSARRARDLW